MATIARFAPDRAFIRSYFSRIALSLVISIHEASTSKTNLSCFQGSLRLWLGANPKQRQSNKKQSYAHYQSYGDL
jgi:hypothetical protein